MSEKPEFMINDDILVSDPKYPDSHHNHKFEGTIIDIINNDSGGYFYIVQDSDNVCFEVRVDEIIKVFQTEKDELDKFENESFNSSM